MQGMKAEWEYYKMIGEYKLKVEKAYSENSLLSLTLKMVCGPMALLFLLSKEAKPLAAFFAIFVLFALISDKRHKRKVNEVREEYHEAHRSAMGSAHRLANVDHGTPIPEGTDSAPKYSDEWYIQRTAELKKKVYDEPT